ncbi:hypothetical protein [Streptomyces siamensis]|uniref:Uncharacterized protein n=1 Tax=Streptomyces siamensis TaxID=1274986 RepID=A0ABP9IKI6_9ACTN
MADLAMPAIADDTILPAAEHSDLAVAVELAERTLNSRNDLAVRESLRILLRAVRAEAGEGQ